MYVLSALPERNITTAKNYSLKTRNMDKRVFVERGIKARVEAENTNTCRHQGLKGKNIRINRRENGVLSMFLAMITPS